MLATLLRVTATGGEDKEQHTELTNPIVCTGRKSINWQQGNNVV